MTTFDRPITGRHFAEILSAGRARMTDKIKEWITPSVVIQAIVALVTIAGSLAVSQWRLNEIAAAQDAMRDENRVQIQKLTDAVGSIEKGQIGADARSFERQKAIEDRLRLVEEDGKTQVQINARIQADIARLSAGRF
jgi:hypothetical protein